MNALVIVLIILITLSALGTIWFIEKRSSCKLPDVNSCTGTDSTGRQQVPYCSPDVVDPSCVDPAKVCAGSIPSNCDFPYCDWKASTPAWKCGSKDSQKFSCTTDKKCLLDPYGQYDSIDECGAACADTSDNCNLVNGKLPYPLTDGTNFYENNMTPDNFGTYSFMRIGSSKACKLSCTNSTLNSDSSNAWCVPGNSGSECGKTELAANKAFPNDPYKGPYPDINAYYQVTYIPYDNQTQYCKVTGCQKNYSYDTAQNLCVAEATPCTVQFATQCDTQGRAIACSDPTDKITQYTPNDTGKSCVGTSCKQPDGDYYVYSNTGANGKCVKDTTKCLPGKDGIVYDPTKGCLPNCGDAATCRAFLGVDSDAKYTFACDVGTVNPRTCVARVDPNYTQWGGCGNPSFPQYGPVPGGTCAQTIFSQRARFNADVTTGPVGCMTCASPQGTDCSPWQTDQRKCTWNVPDCTFGNDTYDPIGECLNQIATDSSPYVTITGNIPNPYEQGQQLARIAKKGKIVFTIVGPLYLRAYDSKGVELLSDQNNNYYTMYDSTPGAFVRIHIFDTYAADPYEFPGYRDIHLDKLWNYVLANKPTISPYANYDMDIQFQVNIKGSTRWLCFNPNNDVTISNLNSTSPTWSVPQGNLPSEIFTSSGC
jgi:hypothetical protein